MMDRDHRDDAKQGRDAGQKPRDLIRPMQGEDAPGVAALIRLAFGAITVPLDPKPSALGETAETVMEQLRQGGGFVWTAGPDEPTVRGCVLWREEAGGIYLGRLSVEPAWQGNGIARALVASVLEEARRGGHALVHVGVRLTVPGNRRFFAAAGFQETVVGIHPGQTHPTWVRAEYRFEP